MKRIRVLDFESAATTPAEGGLCEIGFADVVAATTNLAGLPEDWSVAGGYGRLCDPGCPIPPETQAIHQIDDADVADAPNWKSLLKGLLAKAEADHVIAYAAYGADMELGFMHHDWTGGAPVMVDVYKVGLRVWEDAPHHSNRALQYWRRPEGLNREAALPNHRAYPDAYVTAFLLRDLLNGGTPLEQMIEWSKLPALTTRCYIGNWRNDGKGTPWPEVETSMLEWIISKGFEDKPDIRYTAEVHLERRIAAARAERERQDLNAQFRANGMDEIPASADSAPMAQAPAPDPDQSSLPL